MLASICVRLEIVSQIESKRGGLMVPRKMKFGSILIKLSVLEQQSFRETSLPRTATSIPSCCNRPAIRVSAALISRMAVGRSVMRVNVRSMSTDSRGRSSSKRLMAVPPLMAKQSSLAMAGMHLTTSAACLR